MDTEAPPAEAPKPEEPKSEAPKPEEPKSEEPEPAPVAPEKAAEEPKAMLAQLALEQAQLAVLARQPGGVGAGGGQAVGRGLIQQPGPGGAQLTLLQQQIPMQALYQTTL